MSEEVFPDPVEDRSESLNYHCTRHGGCNCSDRPLSRSNHEEAEEFEFPDQATIDTWNGVIYTLAGVETHRYHEMYSFILSNGDRSKCNSKNAKAQMMPADAYKKTRSVRTYYDSDGVFGFTFFDNKSKPIW